jgi:hypothetical protein
LSKSWQSNFSNYPPASSELISYDAQHILFQTFNSDSLFGWLVADGWCWFVLREEYGWLVAGGWFVLREKYCWLISQANSARVSQW